MMFKRPRLRPGCPLVNVGLAACAIFLAACSGSDRDEASVTVPPSDRSESLDIENKSKLQAVWSTAPLAGPIQDIALSTGGNPVLAAALEDGRMQVFDLDGERLSSATQLDVAALANGRATTLGDVPLTLFPGIDRAGDLKIYLFSAALGAPVAVDLLTGADASGLCSGPTDKDDTLLQLAFWTNGAPRTLRVGKLTTTDETFVWAETEQVEHSGDIGACTLQIGEAPIIASREDASALAQIEHEEQTEHIRLTRVAGLSDDMGKALSIGEGITVKPPATITALAALSQVQFGGYPNGVVVIGGQVDGQPRLVFVEPIGLFATTQE